MKMVKNWDNEERVQREMRKRYEKEGRLCGGRRDQAKNGGEEDDDDKEEILAYR